MPVASASAASGTRWCCDLSTNTSILQGVPERSEPESLEPLTTEEVYVDPGKYRDKRRC